VATVLVSWIGQTDLDASRGEPKAGVGPIGQALAVRSFDEVVLLSNYPAAKTDLYGEWVAARVGTAKLEVRAVKLENPTDFTGIYRAVDPVLQELTARYARRKLALDLVFHLSPGTPAMSTMWMLLGKARYRAELIQSSREKGVVTAAVPFDIVAEFIEMVPALTAQADAALEARSAGSQRMAARFGDIVFRGQVMQAVVERARKVAARSVSVLIEGETGTGKELFARAIHDASPRAKRSFISVNCGALPSNLVESQLFGHKKGAFTGATEDQKGCFRAADGGTLLLDEVGELPLEAQVKLLRVLQERKVTPLGETRAIPVDVRVIAATNRNLALEVQARRFREDLFYRLAVAVLHLPALRERSDDCGPLIDALLDHANAEASKDELGYVPKRLSAAAKTLLMSQRWPGNVRELEHTLMRTTVWAARALISEADVRGALFQGTESTLAPELGQALEDGFDLDTKLHEISRVYIRRALEQTHGNKERARKLLGLNSHQVLSARMKKLGVKPP
jgi:transcriptional regulator with GAF, ATPase, and Fis domain